MAGPVYQPVDGKLTDRVVDEHARLEAAVRRMEHARDLQELLDAIQRLRTPLQAHFADEEMPGGFFDVVRARAGARAAVEALGRDHEVLRSGLESLTRQTLDCLAGPVAEVLRRAAEIARRLREHEAREHRLLTDPTYGDAGQGQ